MTAIPDEAMTSSTRFQQPRLRWALGLSAAIALGTLALSPAAEAAPSPRPGSAAAVAVAGVTPVRVDRDPVFSVTVTGLDNKTRARVDWGDGSGTAVARGTCSVTKARRSPAACSRTLTHAYTTPGTFTISASAASAQAAQPIVVAAKPEAWRPAAGQQFTSWKPLGRQATYTPCQTVEWHFDTTGQPADRSTMRSDILASLAELSALTGLKFVETNDVSRAELTFSWRDLAQLGYANASGVGGFTGPNRGWVAFSPTNEWTNDYWAGNSPKTKQWREGDWIYTLSINGRQSLVTHEVMHAMGFGHVEDFTSIMYPQSIGNGAGALSAGDLEGLRTMYPQGVCPMMPD